MRAPPVRRRLALVLLALLLPCSLALAQAQAGDRRADLRTALEAANRAKVTGPAEIKLLDQATLALPGDMAFVPAREAATLLQAMGNRTDASLLGLVVSPRADWLVVARFIKSGYVKDDDAREWKADELLASIRTGNDETNKERRSRGIPEVEVLGWLQAPTYDATTHRLVWSLQSGAKGAPAGAERGVNYNTYALGREGYVSMNLVTGMRSLAADKPVAHTLLAALAYRDGKRYADFDSKTDHVAEYGLAALIGGVAAKKLGFFALAAALLAKFWKLLAVVAIALFALVRRLGATRGGAQGSPPAPPGA